MCNYDLLGEWVEWDEIIYPNINPLDDKEFNIWVCPHTKEPLFPVFKVYYGEGACYHYNEKLEQAKMCRIRMDKPEYVGLEDEDLILTKELKERFIKEVSRDWYHCIDMMNDMSHNVCSENKEFISINSIIPDYTKLETAD